jgi:membrane fusion protein (multidrug efflux system)
LHGLQKGRGVNFVRKIESEELDTTIARSRRWLGPALTISVPLALFAIGLFFWLTSGRSVSTDNAEVAAHIVNVAPEISGRIIEVHVVENQKVHAGDLLFRIDPEPFKIAVLQAQAAVSAARLQIAELQSGYTSKVADIGSKASDAQAARAVLGTGGGQGHPQVEAARATLAKAQLDLSRTELRAPVAGTISQTERLTPGSMAMQMLANVSIVEAGDPWIEANFKETQLAKIRPGQRAEVQIDAIPGKTYKAHVTGIGAGTGSQFSMLPAQNATGNWVKVTQRVPVRLKLDELPPRLVSGWSAHVTVFVRG